MAMRCPDLFMQLSYDMDLATEDRGNGWRNPGERAEEARDRLRSEREELKRRYGA